MTTNPTNYRTIVLLLALAAGLLTTISAQAQDISLCAKPLESPSGQTMVYCIYSPGAMGELFGDPVNYDLLEIFAMSKDKAATSFNITLTLTTVAPDGTLSTGTTTKSVPAETGAVWGAMGGWSLIRIVPGTLQAVKGIEVQVVKVGDEVTAEHPALDGMLVRIENRAAARSRMVIRLLGSITKWQVRCTREVLTTANPAITRGPH